MPRNPFPLIPRRHHRSAWKFLLLFGVLGVVGGVINRDALTVVVFATVGALAVRLIISDRSAGTSGSSGE
jgi:hypothetical protein